MLTFENNDELKKYLQDNLLPLDEARQITKQSVSSFNQAVSAKRIVPFYQTIYPSGRIQNKLFLRSELEAYQKNKRIR